MITFVPMLAPNSPATFLPCPLLPNFSFAPQRDHGTLGSAILLIDLDLAGQSGYINM
jgi:hypothetical protein